MAEYLVPGVFIEEVETGARPIEGMSTSTVDYVGETEYSPLCTRYNHRWRAVSTGIRGMLLADRIEAVQILASLRY